MTTWLFEKKTTIKPKKRKGGKILIKTNYFKLLKRKQNMSMKFLLSRYGGHGLIFGKGKASSENLPEDQSLENVIDNHAFKMKGFSYLSSYEMMPKFMGAYKDFPKGAIKIAEIDHDFNEVSFQYEVTVNTIVYFTEFIYTNIFAVFLKTNFKDVAAIIGKIEPSYDCVLIIHAIDKNTEEVKKSMPQILHSTLMTLIYEMGIKDACCVVTPSKTSLGKKIDLEKLDEGIESLNEINSRDQLAEALVL